MTDVAVARDSRSGGSGKRVMISPTGPTSVGSRPGTQGRAVSSERLTPMPDYLRPVVRSAVTRWKKLHEDHMMEKLVMKRLGKKEHNKEVRKEAKNIARKIPIEILARDWLSEQRATAETRAFMVDRLLPTLILGVEKLLVEVDKRGLSETTEPDPNFNPINYLARYLMRNNPRYSNYCEASPYVRGLREVGEELRKQLFDIEENKLARVKAEAKRKREEREKIEEAERVEVSRREEALIQQYREWDVGLYPDGRVELALVQNGLLSFRELSESLPDEEREDYQFSQELEPTDDTGKTLLLKEFIAYLHQYVEEMPAEVFDQFMVHLSRCAHAYRISAEREQRRVLLTQVFVSCDHTGVGLLDRHRILNLFEMFYDRAMEDVKETFRNPREWPVVDVLEIDSLLYSDEQNTTFIDNNVDVTMETSASSKPQTPDAEGKKKEGVTSAGSTAQKPAQGGETDDGATATTSAKTEPELSSLTEDQPPKTGDRPPMTQQSRVSFAEGTTFERERTMLSTHGSRSQSQASAFDENTLNMSQFIQLTETFIGDEPHSEGFKLLVRYVREGYMETEEERTYRILKARKEVLSARRKALLNSLFEMWDNDGSGFLDLDEVEIVMKKYKEGIEIDAVARANKDHRKRSRHHDNRLSKREFRDFVYKVIDNMAGAREQFDSFVDFLFNSVERSYAERVRGEARKKWLQQIVQAGETSAVNMEPIYRAVFQALYKDAETHGENKIISANISMLEKNDVTPARGDVMLRYVASTPDDAEFLLGKTLFPDMKSISFSSVETGKPIHVPRVNAHGGVHFWNPDRSEEEREGAFIVIPLKDRRKRVFGLIGIDTLNDPHTRSIFITHEIQFYQGIAKAFSIAYHQVDVRQKTMRISQSAVSWIHRRSPHVREISVYMVEPDSKGSDYVLRKMMVTGHKGNISKYRNPARLERRDNLFRDYLFKCVDNSESVTADAYGERHLAIPIRNNGGLAVTVIDISIADLKALPFGENREMTKMLKLLQMAYREILTEAADGEKTLLLEGERVDDDNRTEILFDRLMLVELRDIMSKLDPKAYAELRSYNEPPKVIHHIVKAVLSVFSPDKAQAGDFDNWANCKQFITPQLSQQIVAYDPTADDTNDVPVELIQTYLQEVPHGQADKHGSIPAKFLYNWVFVCVSLIEHTRHMGQNRDTELAENLTPPNRKLKNGTAAAPATSSAGETTPPSGGEVTPPEVQQPDSTLPEQTEGVENKEKPSGDAEKPSGGDTKEIPGGDTEGPPSGENKKSEENSGGEKQDEAPE